MKIKAWVELRGVSRGPGACREWTIALDDDDDLTDGDIDEIVFDELQNYMSYGWERVEDAS